MMFWCKNEDKKSDIVIYADAKWQKSVLGLHMEVKQRKNKWKWAKRGFDQASHVCRSKPTYVDKIPGMQNHSYVRRASRIELCTQEQSCVHMNITAYTSPSPRMQEHRQKQIFNILKYASSKINPRHVLTPPKVSSFHLNPSHHKTQEFTLPKTHWNKRLEKNLKMRKSLKTYRFSYGNVIL